MTAPGVVPATTPPVCANATRVTTARCAKPKPFLVKQRMEQSPCCNGVLPWSNRGKAGTILICDRSVDYTVYDLFSSKR